MRSIWAGFKRMFDKDHLSNSLKVLGVGYTFGILLIVSSGEPLLPALMIFVPISIPIALLAVGAHWSYMAKVERAAKSRSDDDEANRRRM